jgi:hypothetical protein
VLRASTTGFAVGSRVAQLEAPSFGCMVKAQPVEEREAIYGLIYDMNIDDDPSDSPADSGGEPAAVGDRGSAAQPAGAYRNERADRRLPAQRGLLSTACRRVPPLNLDPVRLCTDGDEVDPVLPTGRTTCG